jgi:Astacin (Peptidase family M12A)
MLLLATGVFAGVLAVPSSGFTIGGDPWPGPTITYFTKAGKYVKAVDRAAGMWNHADVGITFQRASSEQDAQVIVRYGGKACLGWAIVGESSDSRMRLGKGCSTNHIALVAVHEFGHVLGLGHELTKCARMNPNVDHKTATPDHCPKHPESYWLKHPFRSDDIRGARALYMP